MTRTFAVVGLIAVLGACAVALASEPAAPAAPGQAAPAKAAPEQMQWWRDAKFGLFVHWGPVSLTGKELSWSRKGPRPSDHPNLQEIPAEEYDALYKKFNPTKFDADQWVRTARSAGMKYLVFTTKHHDGFSNFATKLSDYNVANSPFKRDICKELADACHKAGLKLGWYYSTRDWYHPDYLKGDNGKYDEFYRGQIRELLTLYGKVDILWFDHVGGAWKDWKFPELFTLVRQLQPNILVNNRAAAFVHRPTDAPAPEIARLVRGDFDTPEQQIGRFQTDRAWESCITLVGGQWSYKPEGEMMSLERCIQTLVRCATGDGNLLLNVGPMPTGEIEPRQVQRLREIGAWIQRYGESLYGTRGGPIPNGEWGGTTFKGNTVYVHVLKWPGDALKLPPLPGRVKQFLMLTPGEAALVQGEKEIVLTVPAAQHDKIDTIIRLELSAPVPLPTPRD